MTGPTYRFESADTCAMCRAARAQKLGIRPNRSQGLRPRKVSGIATTVVRCLRCGLIFANPRPVPADLNQHYDRPPEDYWKPRYFSEEMVFVDQIKRFHTLWTGSGTPRALDIGAGLGKGMAALEHHGFSTFGLEPSPAFHSQAIENGHSPGRLQLTSIEDARYGEGSFDFVVFDAVLEHLQDPAAALTKAASWLAPDGLIHVEVPSAKWLIGRLLNLVHRARGLDYVTNLSPMHPPYHLYEFTLASFELLGLEIGYEVVDHRFYACETFLSGPADRVLRRFMEATDTGMQLEVWLQSKPRLESPHNRAESQAAR